jgi:hypothetical protein
LNKSVSVNADAGAININNGDEATIAQYGQPNAIDAFFALDLVEPNTIGPDTPISGNTLVAGTLNPNPACFVGLFDGNAIKSDDIIARTLAHELGHYLADLKDDPLHYNNFNSANGVLPDQFLFAPDWNGTKRYIAAYQANKARTLNPATPDAKH